MKLQQNTITDLTAYFNQLGLLPANALQHLHEMGQGGFAFSNQLNAAESIHLHIKVADTATLPHDAIIAKGAEPQNEKEGYIKYAFKEGIHFIFSSIPVSQEERAGLASFTFPHLDHIGIDVRDESEAAFSSFHSIPAIAEQHHWPVRKQGGDGEKVYCCHVTVNEKYWVYPAGSVYWVFAFGPLLVSTDKFGCDLRPADPALNLREEALACCGSTHDDHADDVPAAQNNVAAPSATYYNPADLKKFGSIGEFQPGLAESFFDYYGEVFRNGALSAREKSLIALAVAHAVQCPYCIDAYSSDSVAKGWNEAQMMEAVHVAAAIRGGATLVHGVQMMNKVKQVTAPKKAATEKTVHA